MGGGSFSKCGCRLRYHIVLGPLFWESTDPRALPYTDKHPSLKWSFPVQYLSLLL
jgi:hypothetical protein